MLSHPRVAAQLVLFNTLLWSISTHDVINHHLFSNPSSILITGSLFLLTLIRSSFSSLDSRGLLSPHHSTIVRFHHCGATCSLPNYFALFPLHLVSYAHNTATFLVSSISAKLPSSSRHRPNIQTAHSHAITVQMPHKKRHLWRLNILRLKKIKKITASFIGPAMVGPTGPFATALVLPILEHVRVGESSNTFQSTSTYHR